MPCLDIYQNTQLEDEDAIRCFLLAHRCRHNIYAQYMGTLGVAAGAHTLDEYPPDDSWFLRHANAHQLIQQAGFMAPDQTADLTVLAQNAWDNQNDFANWMQMHTMIHQRIDQSLGIFT